MLLCDPFNKLALVVGVSPPLRGHSRELRNSGPFVWQAALVAVSNYLCIAYRASILAFHEAEDGKLSKFEISAVFLLILLLLIELLTFTLMFNSSTTKMPVFVQCGQVRVHEVEKGLGPSCVS